MQVHQGVEAQDAAAECEAEELGGQQRGADGRGCGIGEACGEGGDELPVEDVVHARDGDVVRDGGAEEGAEGVVAVPAVDEVGGEGAAQRGVGDGGEGRQAQVEFCGGGEQAFLVAEVAKR